MAYTAHNKQFGAMAGVARWKSTTKQQIKWLVASVCSPPLRQAADTLGARLKVHSDKILNF